MGEGGRGSKGEDSYERMREVSGDRKREEDGRGKQGRSEEREVRREDEGRRGEEMRRGDAAAAPLASSLAFVLE